MEKSTLKTEKKVKQGIHNLKMERIYSIIKNVRVKKGEWSILV